MFARRMLIALAVLMGLTALAAGVAPRQPTVGESGRSGTPQPAPSPAAKPVQRTLDTESSGQRVVARVGQMVTITVESGGDLDTVFLAEVGTKTVEPGSPARFELLAEVPGSYAIELLESERRIGTLEIRDGDGSEPPATSRPELEPA